MRSPCSAEVSVIFLVSVSSRHWMSAVRLSDWACAATIATTVDMLSDSLRSLCTASSSEWHCANGVSVAR